MQASPQRERPASQLMAQFPSLQLLAPPWTAAHTLLQAPQFCGSLLASTQASPHLVRPDAQSKPHTALVQRGVPPTGDGQAVPQAAQFRASLFTSTHDPAHAVMLPHSLAHLPAWHTSVAEQA